MHIHTLQLKNIRGFSSASPWEFSRKINLFVGPNNAGKSTIIRAGLLFQDQTSLNPISPTIGSNKGEVICKFKNLPTSNKMNWSPSNTIHYDVSLDSLTGPHEKDANGNRHDRGTLPNTEPDNVFFPYLSRRKRDPYSQDVNSKQTNAIHPNLQNLVAKIDRIANTSYPGHKEFCEACKEALGFELTTFSSSAGKQAGLIVGLHQNIPLEAMGEGVSSVAGLLVALVNAKDKIFIIEELENDLHPRALKAILALIVAKSTENQFLISTHSHLVVRYLGALETTKLFSVTSKIVDYVPQSTCAEVSSEVNERRELLESLGYELLDFDIWSAWLIFEESSAERIVREYFIKWFAPKLVGRVQTIAAGGISKVKPRFDDFQRLFVFVHLTPQYLNRAWVFVDGDEKGKETVKELQRQYQKIGWRDQQFYSLQETDFEKYYPASFKTRVEDALGISDRRIRKDKKRELLTDVITWIENDLEAAKQEFSKSAAEWVEQLKIVETALSENNSDKRIDA